MAAEPRHQSSSAAGALEGPVPAAPGGKANQRNRDLEGSWYTVRDVAERLKVSERTVRRWIAVGMLRANKFGRSVRISQRALKELEA
jgi:excisionase family DNA binding protein